MPGLAAKPIVDMLVEVCDLEAVKQRIVPILESQGYDYFWRPTFGDDTPPWYAWFIRRNSAGGRTHHIHMIENTPEFAGHWDRLQRGLVGGAKLGTLRAPGNARRRLEPGQRLGEAGRR